MQRFETIFYLTTLCKQIIVNVPPNIVIEFCIFWNKWNMKLQSAMVKSAPVGQKWNSKRKAFNTLHFGLNSKYYKYEKENDFSNISPKIEIFQYFS